MMWHFTHHPTISQKILETVSDIFNVVFLFYDFPHADTSSMTTKMTKFFVLLYMFYYGCCYHFSRCTDILKRLNELFARFPLGIGAIVWDSLKIYLDCVRIFVFPNSKLTYLSLGFKWWRSRIMLSFAYIFFYEYFGYCVFSFVDATNGVNFWNWDTRDCCLCT